MGRSAQTRSLSRKSLVAVLRAMMVVRPKREISRRRAAHAGLELLRLAAQFVGHQRHFRVNLRRIRSAD